ncbi:MAG TPA: PIN domain-containing protein [Burkholderiales bacterium]|nr:PIN domain-containing protein [Burkholderiales bacterium]
MKSAWRSWRREETATADANILIYAASEGAGEKSVVARELIRELAVRPSILGLQALAEFYSVSTRKYKVEPDFAASLVQDWQKTYHVVHSSTESLNNAMRSAQFYQLNFWDGLLIATVASHGATVLFSEDMQHEQTIDGVRIINPFA